MSIIVPRVGKGWIPGSNTWNDFLAESFDNLAYWLYTMDILHF